MEKTNDLMELVNGCGVAKPADTTKAAAAKETADLLAELGFKTAAANVARKINPILKKAEIAAGGYIEITPVQIQFFLDKKAAEYNKRTMGKKISDSTTRLVTNAYASLLGGLTGATLTANQNFYTTTSSTSVGIDWSQLQNAYGTQYHAPVVYFDEAQRIQPRRGPDSLFARTNDYSRGGPGTIGQYRWNEVTVDQYAGIPPLNILLKFKDEMVKKVFDYFTVASVEGIRDPLLLGRVDDSNSRYYLGQWGDDVCLDEII